LSYVCTDTEKLREEKVPIGVKIFKLRENCLYETSTLTIYNTYSSIESSFSEGIDRELNLVSALNDLQSNLDDFLNLDNLNLTYNEILEQIHSGEQDFSLSLNKFKQDLVSTKNLQLMNNFSPIHFDLKNPTHQNNALGAIFWAVFVIVLLISIGCCYRCCPCCCPAIFKGLKASFEVIVFSFTKCFRLCRRHNALPTDNILNDDIELHSQDPLAPPMGDSPVIRFQRRQLPQVPSGRAYPDLEVFYKTEKPPTKWLIIDSPDHEKVIVAYIPDGNNSKFKALYDPALDKVTDRNGIELKFVVKPDRGFIELFKEQVFRSSPPSWFRDSDRKICLRSNNYIHYDEARKIWFHSMTGKIFSGFNHPVIDDILYEDS